MAASYWQHSFPHGGAPAAGLPEDIARMLLGVQRYQAHPYKAPDMPLTTAWQAGNVALRSIPGHDYRQGRPAIVLVPSLINKAQILDLLPERSMLRWLAGQQINPYLLDWGDVCGDPAQQDMDGIILERLIPALEFVQQHAGNVHALGYCMGGTILTAAAARMKMPLQSIVLLAAPWDFHGGTQALLHRVQFWAPSAFPAIEEKGVLTVDWLQMIFASLDPMMTVRKFANFAAMEEDSEDARLFVTVEDWLNDGVDLPAAVAVHCIRDWFLENRPGRGTWNVSGKAVRPENIKCPALIIASDRDRLVEFATAGALQEKIKHARILKPDCGHIGMIAGRESVEKVWGPVAAWIGEQH
jgi:polyhydroxyalkanoate synthase